MAAYLKINGIFKAFDRPHIKVGQAWKAVEQAWVKNGSVWKPIWETNKLPPKNWTQFIRMHSRTYWDNYWAVDFSTGLVWCGTDDSGRYNTGIWHNAQLANMHTQLIGNRNAYNGGLNNDGQNGPKMPWFWQDFPKEQDTIVKRWASFTDMGAYRNAVYNEIGSRIIAQINKTGFIYDIGYRPTNSGIYFDGAKLPDPSILETVVWRTTGNMWMVPPTKENGWLFLLVIPGQDRRTDFVHMRPMTPMIEKHIVIWHIGSKTKFSDGTEGYGSDGTGGRMISGCVDNQTVTSIRVYWDKGGRQCCRILTDVNSGTSNETRWRINYNGAQADLTKVSPGKWEINNNDQVKHWLRCFDVSKDTGEDRVRRFLPSPYLDFPE